MLLLIKQRYNFESNSQRWIAVHLICSVVAYQAKIQFRKQFTTKEPTSSYCKSLLLIKQRYNFESNSQPMIEYYGKDKSCCLSSKDTISKAIHNALMLHCQMFIVVAYQAKIQFRKQFTTEPGIVMGMH